MNNQLTTRCQLFGLNHHKDSEVNSDLSREGCNYVVQYILDLIWLYYYFFVMSLWLFMSLSRRWNVTFVLCCCLSVLLVNGDLLDGLVISVAKKDHKKNAYWRVSRVCKHNLLHQDVAFIFHDIRTQDYTDVQDLVKAARCITSMFIFFVVPRAVDYVPQQTSQCWRI